jgi:hypothetical protein
LVEIGSVVSEEKIFFLNSSPLFSIFSLAVILVGSRDHRTQFWKGAIQGSFCKSLVAIGPVVSEEKNFFLISSPLFSNLHNRSKWLMGFTSKLQGR